MTTEAKAERFKALKLCLELRKEVEKANGLTTVKAAYRRVEKLVSAFNAVALGRDVDYVRETFLRLTFSGLFQTCVDRALKAIEEGNFFYGDAVVKCAQKILKARWL